MINTTLMVISIVIVFGLIYTFSLFLVYLQELTLNIINDNR